jgi:hypothetical protein
MSLLRRGLQLYIQEYGALPDAADNSKLFGILTGTNPLKLRFCSATEAEHAVGQFLDGWERPYFFIKTADNLIINAAGSDGIHHTKDDLTLEALESRR